MPVLICLRKELWTGLISVGGSSANLPRLHTRKIKSHFGTLVNLPSQYVARSWEGWEVLTTVWSLSFILTIFLHMVWVFFTTPSTCLTSSPSLPVVTIFLAFKAPQGCRDVLIHHLISISNSYFLEYFRVTEIHNVCMCLNFFSTLSDYYSFVVCDTLFSQNCYFFCCTQGQLTTCNNFWGVQTLHFALWKVFILRYFHHTLGYPPTQTNCCFWSFWQFKGLIWLKSPSLLGMKKFCLAGIFQRFNDNESEEFCNLIL